MPVNNKIEQFFTWFFVELVFPLSVPIFAYFVLRFIGLFFVFEKVDNWDAMFKRVIFGGTYTFYGIILTFSVFLKFLDYNLSKKALILLFSLVGFIFLSTCMAFVSNIGAVQANNDAIDYLTVGLILVCIIFSIISKIYFLKTKKS